MRALVRQEHVSDFALWEGYCTAAVAGKIAKKYDFSEELHKAAATATLAMGRNTDVANLAQRLWDYARSAVGHEDR